MPEDRSVPGARPTRQERSRRAATRIADAAQELLTQRDFESIPVADIARTAGTSIGGFYARFPDKQALLEGIDEVVLDEVRATFDAAMDAVDAPGSRTREVVAAYVQAMVEQFRKHRGTIQQIRKHAATGQGGYRARAQGFNAHVHGRLRSLLSERLAEIGHPDPQLAINFALFTVSAAAREGVLGGALAAYPIRVDDELLIAELTRTFIRYLGCEEGS